mgnify:CR=1 FL=1
MQRLGCSSVMIQINHRVDGDTTNGGREFQEAKGHAVRVHSLNFK